MKRLLSIFTKTHDFVDDTLNNNVEYTSYYADSLKRLKKNKAVMISFIVIVILCLMAILAPLISPYDPNQTVLEDDLLSVSWQHWFGTDEYGRDILSRIIYGTRVSLSVGIVSVFISTLIGIVIGSIAGYYGGAVDSFLSRMIEIFSAFPELIFAIGLMFVLGPGIINLFIAIGLIRWTETARLIRGQVMQIKEREFVKGCVASGGTDFWIITKHILPNCLSTIIIIITLGIPGAIMSEASLSFIGLGVQAPQASWGSMINAAQSYIRFNTVYSVIPGIAIIITVLAFNIFGDGLRDALDPRLKN